MMKALIAAAGFASVLGTLSTNALAQDKKAESPHTFTGNIGLVSEYRYRGIAQTDFAPAVQGGFDYSHANGVYLGTWASNVSWLADTGLANNSLEWDFYGGYKRSFGDFSVDAGLLQYYYPGRYSAWVAAGSPKPHTLEAYVAGGWKMFTLKYSHSLSDTFGFADSKGSNYLDLSANFELPQGFTLGAHVGHQKIKTSLVGVDCSYTDWKVGLSKEIVGVTVGLAYVDTNANANCYTNYRGKDLGRGAAILSVSKTF